MTKRQLDIKYKGLADWVKQIKHSDGTSHSLAFILSCIYDLRNEGKISDILNDLNENLTLISSNDLISIIVDIYNDNYELKESSCYWKFKELRGLGRCDLYFGTTFDDEPLLVDISDGGTAEKCTKSELNNYLCDTELTADNFTSVEEIENDNKPRMGNAKQGNF